jgi:hypothetical protein
MDTMRKYILFVVFLCFVGCGSNNEPTVKPKPPAVSGKPEKAEPRSSVGDSTAAPKSASSDADLNGDQFIDPPADLVASLGVDAYPGAKVLKALQAVKGGTETESFRDVIFFTHDPASKVAEFYKIHLPEAKSVGEILQNMNVYALDGKNASGDIVRVQAQTLKDMTHIHVIVRKAR